MRLMVTFLAYPHGQGPVPEDAFPPGWPINQGDAVDLLRKDQGLYEVES